MLNWGTLPIVLLAIFLNVSSSQALEHIATYDPSPALAQQLNATITSTLQPRGFRSAKDAHAYCEQFADLFESIEHDLLPWAEAGITRELVEQSSREFTMLSMRKGLHLGYSQGKAYVVYAGLKKGFTGHHANIMFTYMRILLELEELFGTDIPDLEFVIATSDRPMVLRPPSDIKKPPPMPEVTRASPTPIAQQAPSMARSRQLASSNKLSNHALINEPVTAKNVSPLFDSMGVRQKERQSQERVGKAEEEGGDEESWVPEEGSAGGGARQVLGRREEEGTQTVPLPVFRFCSSPGHYDIRVPIFHFYTKKYTQKLLDHVGEVQQSYPWKGRLPVLFGRFARYNRHVDPNVSATWRQGRGGQRVCEIDSPFTATCRVRQHLFYVVNHPELKDKVDLKSSPRLPMLKHAKYKYLVHVDGQALSSRLEQLLPLGSLILKEESGYTAFFHHLLKPFQHYIPFWVKDPLDLIDSLAWAQANDAKAQEIGATGQAFALKYLGKRPRTCYWYKLLSSYAKLLSYKPSSRDSALDYEWVPIREYFETVAKKFENGAWYQESIEE